MAGYARTIDELGELSAAEEQLVDAACSGEVCRLGDGERPDGPSEERDIRAEVIRYLALGGCEERRVHENGIDLYGANITGQIDLANCEKVKPLGVMRSLVLDGIVASNAKFSDLFLNGSECGSLNFQGASFSGHLFLRKNFSCEGEVNLIGSTIKGQFNCNQSTLSNKNGFALTAENARFEGQFYWIKVTVLEGDVSFIRARIDAILDDDASWPSDGLFLDGLEYGTILGLDLNVEKRLSWLAKNKVTLGFEPQPYQQLAKVYGEMGHRRDRGTVLIEMENRLRNWQVSSMFDQASSPWAYLVAAFHWLIGKLAKWVVGYGHRPARSLIWAIGVILLTSLWAKSAWDEGSMTPSAAQVLVSSEWQELAGPDGSKTPGIIWSEKTEAGQDYETFHPIAYASDLFIPLVDFGQESAWAPSTNRGPWGWHLWWARWFIEGFGWIITAMGAAAITGFMRND